MPFVEVVCAKTKPLSKEQKRMFAQDALKIFTEVISTRPGALRIAFQQLEPEDSILLLEERGTD